jgi:hypothetical protein
MKSNTRASKQNKNTSIIAKISDFVSLNAFALLLLILAIWVHQVYVVGATVERVEMRQNAMVKYLKENVNKVYFLSASGMAITATRSEVSYTDERFKSYIANEIIDKLISGNIVLSSNYKITYVSGDEIITKNKRINDFYTRFVSPDKAVLTPFVRALHRAVVDARYPEYINVLTHKYTQYTIQKPNEKNGYRTTIKGGLQLTVLVKSWIREVKQWDTREVSLNIPFTLYIDVAKYVNIGNPFGIHFTSVKLPVLHKPTATQVVEGKL